MEAINKFKDFFIKNPQKILGKIKETSTQFGGVDYTIDGPLSNLENIDVSDEDIIYENDTINDVQFVELSDIISKDAEILNTVNKKTRGSKSATPPKNTRSVRKKRSLYEDGEIMEAIDFAELNDSETVFKYLNNGTDDELLAFYIGKKLSTSQYPMPPVQLLNKFFALPQHKQSQKIIELLENGILCLTDNENELFAPYYLYYTGNTYVKVKNIEEQVEGKHYTVISRLLMSNFAIEISDEKVRELLTIQMKKMEETKPKKIVFSENIEKSLIITFLSSYFRKVHAFIEDDLGNLSFKLYEEYESIQLPYGERVSMRDLFGSWVSSNMPHDTTLSFDTFKKLLNEIKPPQIKRSQLSDDEIEDIETQREEEGMEFKRIIDALIHKFILNYFSTNQLTAIENAWNKENNTYVETNYKKVPVYFRYSKWFKDSIFNLRDAQREGVGFMNALKGGIIAYDVGVGKTATAICHLAELMDNGIAKKPLVVVPKATYEKWIGEIHGFTNDEGDVTAWGILPHFPLMPLNNLNKQIAQKLRDKYQDVDGKMKLPDNTIYITTYEGLENLGFDIENPEIEKFIDELSVIQNTNKEATNKRSESNTRQKYMKDVGTIVDSVAFFFDELGFDSIVIDEAHNMNHIFASAKADAEDDNDFKINVTPSLIGVRSFFISNYLQRRGKYVCLLTATPFSNNPLEVYSMMALANLTMLQKNGVKNIRHFFETYANITIEKVVSVDKVKMKPVMKSWVNKPTFQNLFFSVMNYKTGESVGIKRPIKHKFPQLSENGVLLPRELQRYTYLQPNELQVTAKKILMLWLKKQLDDNDLRKKAPYLKLINYSKGITLTPYAFNGFGELIVENYPISAEDENGKKAKIDRNSVSYRKGRLSVDDIESEGIDYQWFLDEMLNSNYKTFVESSPKLMFMVDVMKSVKQHHKKTNTEESCSIVYSEGLIGNFGNIKQYLIKEVGFLSVIPSEITGKKASFSEVEIIAGGIDNDRKEDIKELFNAGIVKVIIGSKTIAEGIDLQKKTTMLYNLWISWNPTTVKQLEGRLWRFGNIYKNVRIVTPLLIGSLDAFSYQLLEEKTARISDVFDRNNDTSILDTSDVDLAQQKTALIDDIGILVNEEIDEVKKKQAYQIKAIDNNLEPLKSALNFLLIDPTNISRGDIIIFKNELFFPIIQAMNTFFIKNYLLTAPTNQNSYDKVLTSNGTPKNFVTTDAFFEAIEYLGIENLKVLLNEELNENRYIEPFFTEFQSYRNQKDRKGWYEYLMSITDYSRQLSNFKILNYIENVFRLKNITIDRKESLSIYNLYIKLWQKTFNEILEIIGGLSDYSNLPVDKQNIVKLLQSSDNNFAKVKEIAFKTTEDEGEYLENYTYTIDTVLSNHIPEGSLYEEEDKNYSDSFRIAIDRKNNLVMGFDYVPKKHHQLLYFTYDSISLKGLFNLEEGDKKLSDEKLVEKYGSAFYKTRQTHSMLENLNGTKTHKKSIKKEESVYFLPETVRLKPKNDVVEVFKQKGIDLTWQKSLQSFSFYKKSGLTELIKIISNNNAILESNNEKQFVVDLNHVLEDLFTTFRLDSTVYTTKEPITNLLLENRSATQRILINKKQSIEQIDVEKIKEELVAKVVLEKQEFSKNVVDYTSVLKTVTSTNYLLNDKETIEKQNNDVKLIYGKKQKEHQQSKSTSAQQVIELKVVFDAKNTIQRIAYIFERMGKTTINERETLKKVVNIIKGIQKYSLSELNSNKDILVKSKTILKNSEIKKLIDLSIDEIDRLIDSYSISYNTDSLLNKKRLTTLEKVNNLLEIVKNKEIKKYLTKLKNSMDKKIYTVAEMREDLSYLETHYATIVKLVNDPNENIPSDTIEIIDEAIAFLKDKLGVSEEEIDNKKEIAEYKRVIEDMEFAISLLDDSDKKEIAEYKRVIEDMEFAISLLS